MNQKKKIFLSLGLMAVLAAGLSAYAFFGVFADEKAAEARKEKEEKLFSLDTSTLRKLVVEAKGQRTALEKRGERWWIVDPVEAEADEGEVDGLLQRLASARRKKVLLEDAGLGTFGLEPASIRIEGEDASGAKGHLAIGAKNEFDGSVYVNVRATEVLTAEGSLSTAFEKNTFELREKRLLTFSDEGLESIEAAGKRGWTLAQRDGAWHLETPTAERADDEVASGIRRALRNLRAVAFPASSAEALGLGEPEFTVELRRKEEEPLLLQLFRKEEKVYARVGAGALAEVAGGVLEELDKGPEALRDQRLLPFEAKEALRLHFIDGEAELVAERASAEGDWRLVQPKEAKAKQWKLSSALSSLASLRPDEVLEKPAAASTYGLDSPARRVRVLGAEGKELAELHIGKEEDGATFVRAKGAAKVYEVRSGKLTGLPFDLSDVEETSTGSN